MNNCSICKSEDIRTFFVQKNIPVFQNVTYLSYDDSRRAIVSDVVLSQCNRCKFVFNSRFDPEIMKYDSDYQNEQASSSVFQNHLNDVYGILKNYNLQSCKVVEIGCGKGFFLQVLKKNGVDIIGYDPAYEGTDPSIVKEYFNINNSLQADLIILRHTLEHIDHPYEFLRDISAANRYRGLIYIEVPTFDWIFDQGAFEDIFYEHCNYFTLDSLQLLFRKSQSGTLFNGQYIYIVADLKDLKDDISTGNGETYFDTFSSKISKYKNEIEKIENLAIWGAGAKGSTFLNLLDSNCKLVRTVIDINQKKQNRYIAHSGHKIISPCEIGDYGIENIIVMNNNYYTEVESFLKNSGVRIKQIN